jgi:outer membrane protein TolC
LNFVRIKGGQGLPLEVLDSTRRLSDVLLVYADALSDYDRARMRLLVALGLPTANLVDLGKISPKVPDSPVPLGNPDEKR